MGKFVNQVGDVADPFFIEVVQRSVFTASGEPAVQCVTVFDFRRLSNSPIFDPTDIAAVFQAAWVPALIAITCDSVSYTQTECRALDDPAAATAVDPSAGNGALEEDVYASDTAVYFQLKSGFRGRSFFGSKHLPGASESHVSNGYLSGGGVTAWTTIKTLLLAWTTTGLVDGAGNAWKLIVLSRTLSDLEASPAIITGADVVEVLLNRRIGTMGRRRGVREAV
jgi:hypothetical protein